MQRGKERGELKKIFVEKYDDGKKTSGGELGCEEREKNRGIFF